MWTVDRVFALEDPEGREDTLETTEIHPVGVRRLMKELDQSHWS